MFKTGLRVTTKLSQARINRRSDKISNPFRQGNPWLSLAGFLFKIIVITFFGGFILFPFFFFISQSLVPREEFLSGVTNLVPQSGADWSNFTKAYQSGYLESLAVTLAVVAVSVALRLLVVLLMGYGLAYRSFWGKRLMWLFLLSILAMPEMGLLSGQLRMATQLQLRDGAVVILTMTLPYLASVFAIFLFRNAFGSIPTRIKEAALVDGATEFKYFWKVAIPLVRPAIWTVVILTIFAAWNSYTWPRTIAQGRSDFMNPFGLWVFYDTGNDYNQFGQLEVARNVRLAASILTTLPVMIFYFAFRGRIMKSISRSSLTIKG